jgi:Glycosyl transferase family 64 domain
MVEIMNLLFKPRTRTAAAAVATNKKRISTVPAYAGLIIWMVLVGLVAENLVVFDVRRSGGNSGNGGTGSGTIDAGVARRPPAADEHQSTITQQKQISVVMMNHHRPTLLRDSSLLRTLSMHPAVGQILILHSNPATAFNNTYLLSSSSSSLAAAAVTTRTTKQQKKKNDADADNDNDTNANDWLDKIQHVDAVTMNEQMGLAIRFYFCAQQAHYEYVLIVDDDMECQMEAITILLQKMRNDPHRIVGRYGRIWSSKHHHRHRQRHDDNSDEYDDGEYALKNVYGTVEVVLTKFMLMEKIVCDAFVQHQHVMDDIALSNDNRPIWNGEDIFVNLVANRLHQVPSHGPYTNLALSELPVWDIAVGSKLLLSSPSSSGTTTGSNAVSVSGNPRGFLSTLLQPKSWNDYSARRQQTRRHRDQRTKMWKLAKQRLANVTVVVVETVES